MDVKVIDNSREFNITVGNIYKVIEETEDFYIIINDKEIESKYGKSYFERVETFTYSIDAKEQKVTYHKNGAKNVVTFSNLTTGGTSISCGIYQVYYITSFTKSIYECMKDLSYEEKVIIAKEYLLQYLPRTSSRYYLASCNLNYAYIDFIRDVFGEPQHTGMNPNSSNMIGLWVMDRDNLANLFNIKKDEE